MFDFVTRLFDTQGFPPRWSCGAAWQEEPGLGWLHIGSDLAIFARTRPSRWSLPISCCDVAIFPFPESFGYLSSSSSPAALRISSVPLSSGNPFIVLMA